MIENSHTFPMKYPAIDFYAAGEDLSWDRKGLNPNELKALETYTSSKYKTLNRDIRNNVPPEKRIQELTQNIDSGLDKIAKADSGRKKTFRGIDTDLPSLQENKTFSDPAYLSTSYAQTPRSRQTVRRTSEGGTACVVIGKNGADISKGYFSTTPHEQEVLYPRNSEYNVVFKSKISPEAQEKIGNQEDPVISKTAKYVAVLTEKGMPERSISDMRKSMLDVDLSPSISPVSEVRLRNAAIRKDNTSNTYDIDISPSKPPVSHERIDLADIA